MALYVYRISDGRLYSWSPNDDAPVASDQVLTANGLAKVTGLAALDNTHEWDAPTHSVVVVVFTPQKPLSLVNWCNRFTAAEIVLLKASTNQNVVKFLFLLPLASNQTVDVNSQMIQNAVSLLLAQGILATQARADAMLA